jgi:N-acetyl-anhydromuramyl-L-alanine amidase AmpD
MKCVSKIFELLFGSPGSPTLSEILSCTRSPDVEDLPDTEEIPREPEPTPPEKEEVPMPQIPAPLRKDMRIQFGRSEWPQGSIPDVIIMHYSAGYSVAGCFKALTNRKLSVHASIERDGVLYDHRKWSERAIHAGYGVWRGRQDLNHRSFGVEVINLGWLEGPGNGSDDPKLASIFKWGPPADELVQGDQEFFRLESNGQSDVRIITKTDCSSFTDHRDAWAGKLWSEYPEAQKQATLWLAWDWIAWTASQNGGEPTIPIENVVGHEHVRKGGKTDPGPAFFWAELYDYLMERAAEELPVLLNPTWNPKARVAAVQSHVHRLGIDVGSIDGVWGKNTQAGAEKALELFGPVYSLGEVEVSPQNTLALCRAFVQIPGFDPKAADHGGISDDLASACG